MLDSKISLACILNVLHCEKFVELNEALIFGRTNEQVRTGETMVKKRNKSNLVNTRTKLIIPCKNGGVCIKNPKHTANIICKGCERETIW